MLIQLIKTIAVAAAHSDEVLPSLASDPNKILF
jgi:hypothetical protein